MVELYKWMEIIKTYKNYKNIIINPTEEEDHWEIKDNTFVCHINHVNISL